MPVGAGDRADRCLCAAGIFGSVAGVKQVAVESVTFRTRWMQTRFPFQYGIASMTELPHVFVCAQVVVDGTKAPGLASEGLPPKWFTKDPTTRFEEDLPGMVEVIKRAGEFLPEAASGCSLFAAWRSLYGAQDEWARGRGCPPLLAHLGTSLLERALIDGFCRATGQPFVAAVHENAFGIDLGAIHSELAGSCPADWLPSACASVAARHTIGLGDPLRAEDVLPGDRLADGLPHALVDAIRGYGLTHFKVKICGDLEVDVPRLQQIAAILRAESPGFRFTLDGNEQYRDIATFRSHWETFLAVPELQDMLQGGGLLFVEQPLHRDVALADRVATDLAGWPDGPSMIIDESDGDLLAMRRALQLGYRGTSHKNCKGVIKGLANRCLIEWQRRHHPGDGPWLMSGEDLANVGPVALLNDLAAMAVLGIEDVERNGHHYFAGLSMYPEALQQRVCARHPDLYGRDAGEFAALRIREGRISTASVLEAPFGHGLDLDEEVLAWLGDEGLPG